MFDITMYETPEDLEDLREEEREDDPEAQTNLAEYLENCNDYLDADLDL